MCIPIFTFLIKKLSVLILYGKCKTDQPKKDNDNRFEASKLFACHIIAKYHIKTSFWLRGANICPNKLSLVAILNCSASPALHLKTLTTLYNRMRCPTNNRKLGIKTEPGTAGAWIQQHIYRWQFIVFSSAAVTGSDFMQRSRFYEARLWVLD